MADKNFKEYEDFLANVNKTFSEDVKSVKKSVLAELENIPTESFAETYQIDFKLTKDGCFIDLSCILNSTNKDYCNKVIKSALEDLTSTKRATYDKSTSSNLVGTLKFLPLI